MRDRGLVYLIIIACIVAPVLVWGLATPFARRDDAVQMLRPSLGCGEGVVDLLV
ncbi:MAG: hypothetical protein WC246_01625 [Candidatus Paceibacterota bacterium]|jgi:hypothetical protein